MDKITVKLGNQDTARADVYARFNQKIQGKTYRFAVTKLPLFGLALTERRTGMKVCDVPAVAAFRAGVDADAALLTTARNVLQQLLFDKSESRVRQVIDAAPSLPKPAKPAAEFAAAQS